MYSIIIAHGLFLHGHELLHCMGARDLLLMKIMEPSKLKFIVTIITTPSGHTPSLIIPYEYVFNCWVGFITYRVSLVGHLGNVREALLQLRPATILPSRVFSETI